MVDITKVIQEAHDGEEIKIDTKLSEGSLHCCACDRPFHPKWYGDRFEELCNVCLTAAFDEVPEYAGKGDIVAELFSMYEGETQ